MKRHVREIIKGLQDMGASVRVVTRRTGHVHLRFGVGEFEHLLVVASTPTSTDYTVRNALKEARKRLERGRCAP